MERAIGGGRDCDSDWRSRGARRRRGAPAAGSGHVSRHRDLRRQHRDPRGPVHLPAARSSAQARAARRCSSSSCSTAYAFVVEGGSSVGRATLMAAIYFRGAALRSPDAALERRRADRRDSLLRPIRFRSSMPASRSPSARRSAFSSGMSKVRGPVAGVAVAARALALAGGARVVRGNRAAAGQRVRVLARHLRRPHRQLRRDSADDDRADCRAWPRSR